MIIGTAGHIDHGKTSLVNVLTGVDTDRLKEEKARGISIDLGFAYLPAPDGTVLEKAGATRDGGSYEARMGGVACWNAVMDENDYLVKKWNEFIAA